MPDKLKKTLLGAVIAVALAAAVSYGLISQQTADKIQTEANQTLSDQQPPATPQQQTAPPSPPRTDNGEPAPQNPSPAR